MYFWKNKSNITPWWSRLKHRETDSCSLRKQPAFGDATTGFPATWRLMNERPQASMEFLRSFLRRHFAGKPGGVAKCRPDCWLLYCMSQSGRMLLQVSSMDPSLRASAIGQFRVPKLTLTFKVRPKQNISCENQFYLHENETSFLLISEYNDKNLYFVSLKSLKFIVHLYSWRHLMNLFMSLLVNCFVSEVMNVWKSYYVNFEWRIKWRMIIAVLCLSYKTIPYLKSRKKRCLINKRSDDVGRKTKFVKIWDWLAYPERTR